MKEFNCFDKRDINNYSYHRYSVLPNLKDLNEAEYLILSHATSSIFLNSIVKKGLLVNSETNIKVKDNLETDSNCIYLGAGDFKFYMERAVREFGGEGIVVVVKVKKTYLRADENSLNYYDKNNPTLSKDEKIIKSMALMGACKHIGNIPVESIIQIYSRQGKILYTN